MKTATRLDNLQVLGSFLENRLHSEFPHIVPFQVRCLLKEGMLLILAQHPANVVPDPQEVFSLLQQAVEAEQPEFPLPVRLYLRVQGTRLPYTLHKFTVEPSVETFHITSVQTIAAPVEEEPDLEASLETRLDVPAERQDSTETDSSYRGGVEMLHITSLQSRENWTSGEEEDEPAHTATSWEQVLSNRELEPDEMDRAPLPPVSSKRWRLLLPLLIAATGISLVALFSSFYALTRPCVIGSCMEIPIAQQLSNKSAQTLRRFESEQEILAAKQQLTKAIRTLKTIPLWSSEHKDAQKLLKAYQAEAYRLDETLKGLKQATQASQKSQNPPHSAPEWVEIQQLWQGAIAQMQQVPKDSNVYPLAQQKLNDYQVNLAIVNQRLTAEQQAAKQLGTAKETAQVAQALQGVAQSLENWQRVNSTWQKSVNQLKQVPQGTTAYTEAQQMLTLYQPQLAVARDRQAQEQLAANAYKQSFSMAQQAKNSQTNNQWSQALSNWRDALNYLNQIPSGTFYYNKTQPLISSYTDSLQQAQAKLHSAMTMQEATKDLKQTCSGAPRICNYTITSNVIKVRMTPDYAQTVRQTALEARARGDYKAQIGVVNHVLTLGEALEAISKNAQLRLEIYGPDGALVQVHNP
jgi:hypothetical protein